MVTDCAVFAIVVVGAPDSGIVDEVVVVVVVVEVCDRVE